MNIASKSPVARAEARAAKKKAGKAKRKLGGWKPTIIPEGFMLIQDTREREPLFKIPPKGLVMVRDTLTDGDYSVRGFESKMAIERKMVSDFFAYIGKERDRTVLKLRRLSAMHFAALVIEAEEDELYMPQMYTALCQEHVRAFFRSLRVRYGIHLYISPDREKIERYVLDSLTKAYEIFREI